MRPRRLVVMSAVFGDPCEKTFAITSGFLASYAAKIGASLFIMRDHSGLGDGPHWEKCRIADFLRQGVTVIWIDADAVVTPWCPDLSQLFPKLLCDIAVCDEVASGYWGEKHTGLRGCVSAMARQCGRPFSFPQGDSAYYNTGVMVINPNPRTISAFTLRDRVQSDCVWEQSWLNLKFREDQLRIAPLPRAYNEMQFYGDIIHAAGLKWPQKNERLQTAVKWIDAAPKPPCWLGQYP